MASSSSMFLASSKLSSLPPYFHQPISVSSKLTTTRTTAAFSSPPKSSSSSIRHEKAAPLCKATLQTSTNNSPPASNVAAVGNNEQQWKLERQTLLGKIQNLQLKIQELATKSSSSGTGATTSDKNNNGGAAATKPLEDILQDFYTLGVKILDLEGKNNNNSGQKTPVSVSTALANIAEQLQVLAVNGGLLKVDPNPNVGDDSRKLDQMVQDVVDLYHGDIETPYYLSGNFGPVREETPPTSDLVITGQIPETLNGMMFRVGPDPKFDPEANYRWLDGDGMVHAIRIKNGKATYVARYVKTSRFLQEDAFGKATMFKYGDLDGAYGLFVAFIQYLRAKLEVLDMSFGYTTSNVGLVHHAGRVMALEDFGKPHVILVKEDGDLETLGINDYNGRLNHTFTPHPKKDAQTGEMFFFGSMHLPPYAIYRVVSPDGTISDPVPITVSGPTYMHDFSITENYVIFMDNPYVFSPEGMVLNEDGNNWIFNFDSSKKSRFGILPRYATSEEGIKWFDFDVPFFVFHNANSWEEDGDKVVLYCCKMIAAISQRTGKPYLAPVTCRSGSPAEGITLPQFYKMTFNMSTGEATQEMLDTTFVDLPRINENYMGRKSRYVYTGEISMDSKTPSIIKYDLESDPPAQKLKLQFGVNIFASEHVFVPRRSDIPIAEDDGYLINFVHDENTDKAFVYIIDAQKMETMATIELPKRVPYGFHSIFVTEEELQAQVMSLT